mgnify:CR=1 FL=1
MQSAQATDLVRNANQLRTIPIHRDRFCFTKNATFVILITNTIMVLEILLIESQAVLKLIKNKRVIDFETAKYYHDLSDVLTPLEVTDIIKKGFVIKDGTAIYGELLTGLISTLDKLLIRTSIDIKSLKGYKIQGNLGTDNTSYKIASAFVEGLKI